MIFFPSFFSYMRFLLSLFSKIILTDKINGFPQINLTGFQYFFKQWKRTKKFEEEEITKEFIRSQVSRAVDV